MLKYNTWSQLRALQALEKLLSTVPCWDKTARPLYTVHHALCVSYPRNVCNSCSLVLCSEPIPKETDTSRLSAHSSHKNWVSRCFHWRGFECHLSEFITIYTHQRGPVDDKLKGNRQCCKMAGWKARKRLVLWTLEPSRLGILTRILDIALWCNHC